MKIVKVKYFRIDTREDSKYCGYEIISREGEFEFWDNDDRIAFEYDNIPDAILLAINNHVLRGQHCGHFVTAVLSNDLIEAVNRADDECQKCLRSIVRYLYNRCPGGCWGSKKKMEEWRKNGGIEGKEVGDIGDLIYPK
jgi:hypothetical protein